MKVKVKLRFNSSKERIEKYGQDKYIVYVPYSSEEINPDFIAALLSRYLGLPASRIFYSGKDSDENWIFELT